MSVFQDDSNTLLYFDRNDPAQILTDVFMGFQVYNTVASRDSGAMFRVASMGSGALLGNYAYNAYLRDMINTIEHPADAVINAVKGHAGTAGGDLMLAAGGYGAYKSGSYIKSRLPTKAPKGFLDTVEVEGEEIIEGAFEVLPEVLEGAAMLAI
jgi:hypothetical protein